MTELVRQGICDVTSNADGLTFEFYRTAESKERLAQIRIDHEGGIDLVIAILTHSLRQMDELSVHRAIKRISEALGG